MDNKKEKSSLTPIIVSNSYIKKYYLDPRLDTLPKDVKDTLKIVFVKLTEDVGGVLELVYDNDSYEVFTRIVRNDDDLEFDEINANFRLSKLEKEHEKLFVDIATFCKFKFNGLV